MKYEARHSRSKNIALAAASLLLSILGLAIAGVIPTASGEYPVLGWSIVAACLLAAIIFLTRAFSLSPQARADEHGIWARGLGQEPVPWSEIGDVTEIRLGIQRIVRCRRSDGRSFGINTTFYDPGHRQLIATIRHHRPDLPV